ncbi:universal stress protein [Nocardioides dubius]
MTKIIVTGVDDSDTAAAAARKAAEIAAAFGGRLHILSAYGDLDAETINIGTDEILVSNEQEAEQTVHKVLAELRQTYPELEITSAASEGRPGEALVKAAENLNADLIVLGNKRVQGIARVLGSIAKDVAAHAPCDVYIAHTHHR